MDLARDISIIYRKMNTEMNTLLAPLGLTSPKAGFLFCLYDHGSMTQAEIGRALYMDRSSVAKMLDRLEKDELIVKEVNPQDVRSYLVTLTDKARELVPQAKQIQNDWFENWMTNLTDFEKRNLYELLEKAVMTLE